MVRERTVETPNEKMNLARVYLARIQEAKLTPNFLMSEEYLEKSDPVCHATVFDQGFKCSDSDEWLIPPIPQNSMVRVGSVKTDESVWMYFPVLLQPAESLLSHRWIFCDFQIIYNPVHFLHMVGHPWQVFRKNVTKYPRRSTGKITYTRLRENQEESQIVDLIVRWSKGKEIHDHLVMIQFLLRGENRAGLFLDDKLVGMNVWDWNFKYINFRYCVDDGSPFLQEYLRYRFYTDPEILKKGKLVNDGGSLGSEGLLQFKLKLNPIQVFKVYSLKPKEKNSESGTGNTSE